MAKVLLGLSGGVDSAVAAYLLKEAGHTVTCLFMRNWDSALNQDQLGNPTLNDPVCPQEKDYNDAKAVAEQLELPLLRVDFIKEYWDYVFESFLEDYKKGRTPNPDILCNKYIKFQSFFDYAMTHGFDYVATGHYAKVIHYEHYSELVKGLDVNKDQSYFLCQVAQTSLHKTLFPLGELCKDEVRRIAVQLGLVIADKKDSTGICFIGERNFKSFLNNYLPAKNGPIIELTTGDKLHTHEGVLYYTIGQRKGLGIGGAGGPWVVVGKDVQLNELYVTHQDDPYWIYSDACIVTGINWFNTIHKDSFDCMVKFRYRQTDQPCIVKLIDSTTAMVQYPQKIAAVTLGQAAVFYNDTMCLGGGTIEKTFLNSEDKEQLIKDKRNSVMQ